MKGPDKLSYRNDGRTLVIVHTAKPMITSRRGKWLCESDKYLASGESPIKAYESIVEAHRNEHGHRV